MDIQFSLGEICSLPKGSPRLQTWLLWFPTLCDRKVVGEDSFMPTSAKQDKRKRLEASILALVETKAFFIIQAAIKIKLKYQIIIPTKVTAASNTLGNKSQMRVSPWGSQMMGQSVQMTPNWGEWLIHQRLCCYPGPPPPAEEMGWQLPHQQHSTTQTATEKYFITKIMLWRGKYLLSYVQKKRNNKSPCNLLF